ncbi:hypothetical protein AJ79_02770 [Helicocarpus griseus UAMH5409]|uniref:Uncharacterized protein n=1 Tax=Helicocarpus griseus UAMH5409 TaxID=1447875 RepID=A0A2B7Y2H1_9EURO|nr:hypothetical protein AJ79_02770 [Helicocarpus griseus UAMH5409]
MESENAASMNDAHGPSGPQQETQSNEPAAAGGTKRAGQNDLPNEKQKKPRANPKPRANSTAVKKNLPEEAPKRIASLQSQCSHYKAKAQRLKESNEGFRNDILSLHKKHEWLGGTLRLISPNLQGISDTNPCIANNGFLRRATVFYENSALRFLTLATCLLKPLSGGAAAERLHSLIEIMATAGNLMLSLRQQNYHVVSCYHDSTEIDSQRFNRDSKLMDPHSAMRLKPDDRRLDGIEVNFVIQPAIIARWFEGQGKIIRSKVWAKAVVWVDGPKQIRAKEPDGEKCIGVSGTGKEAWSITHDADNPNRSPLNRMQQPFSADATAQSRATHAMLPPSGTNGFQATPTDVFSRKNKPDKIAPNGLGGQATSVKVSVKTPRSNPTQEVPEKSMTTFETGERDMCPMAETLPRSAFIRKAKKSNSFSDPGSEYDSTGDYAPSECNEAEEVLVQKASPRKSGHRKNKKKDKKRAQSQSQHLAKHDMSHSTSTPEKTRSVDNSCKDTETGYRLKPIEPGEEEVSQDFNLSPNTTRSSRSESISEPAAGSSVEKQSQQKPSSNDREK